MCSGNDGATGGGGSGTCGAAQAITTITLAGRFLSVTGDAPEMGGIADPSVFYPLGAATGYLAYTNTPMGMLEVHLAKSTDAGATWTFVSKVNTPAAVSVPSGGTIDCGQSTCQGALVHETGTVIVDPTDPDPSRRFKVASQAIFDGIGFRYIHG